MNIKEACRYSNFLTEAINSLYFILNDSEYYVKITKQHKYSEAKNEIADKEEIILPSSIFGIEGKTTENVIKLTHALLMEKSKLMAKIEEAKKIHLIDLTEEGIGKVSTDIAISLSKTFRQQASVLQKMDQFSTIEKQTNGTSYTFNLEGNQVSFSYPMVTKTESIANTEYVKRIYVDYLSLCDKISIEVEKINLIDAVDIIPKFNIHKTVKDFIRNY